MTRLILLFGCYDLEKKPVAPPPGTPEASLFHRPAWATHSGYAPAPPKEILSLGEAHTGPLDGDLITCAMTTTYRGDRQGLIASLFNRDTRSPDSDGLIWQGSQYVQSSGPSNSSRGTFGATRVSLGSGEELKLTLQDRGFIRSHQYDRLVSAYPGEAPFTLSGEHSEASCSVVPREVVQRFTERAVQSTRPGFEAMAERTPQLYERDLGEGLAVDPRPNVQDVAGLVGWDAVVVRELVAQIDREEDRFERELGEAMVAHRPQMGTSAEVDGLFLEPLPMSCPRFGYRKHGRWTDCGLEVRWMGAGAYPTLYDGRGRAQAGFYNWVEVGAEPGSDLQFGEIPTDREIVVVIPLEDPEPPYQIRVQGSEEIEWVAVSCTGPRC